MMRFAVIFLMACISVPGRRDDRFEAPGIRVRVAGEEETVEVELKSGWTAVLRTRGTPVRLLMPPPHRVVFDFESDHGWRTVEGKLPHAFTRSTRVAFGQVGRGFIGTCEVERGFDDGMTGVLESPVFTIDRPWISMRVGGGRHPDRCYVALIEGDREVFKITGQNSEAFRSETRDVAALKGKKVFLRVVDRETGGWGHINLDHVVLADGAAGMPVSLRTKRVSSGRKSLSIEYEGAGWSVTRSFSAGPVPGTLHVAVTARSSDRASSIEDRLSVALAAPFDLVWSQHVKRAREDVIPHWGFKSPAVIFQKGAPWVALVPDLSGDLRESPLALDLEADPPWLGCGLIPSTPRYHSGFVRDPDGAVGTPSYGYFILAGEAARTEGFRGVTAFLWRQYGSKALAESPDLQRNAHRKDLCLFESWRKEAWERYASETYREFEIDGVPCATLVSRRAKWAFGEGTEEDAWFNHWFQTLRTAYGWHLAGHRKGAERILNLALRAPRKDGFFATIYDVGAKKWWADDGWAGYRDSHHTFCMSWTAYWMLRWIALVPSRKEEILAFVRPYGEALLRLQREDGAIPSWIGTENRTLDAEVAGSALLLAELSSFEGDNYLAAAKKAMDFVVREVLPRRRWFDFETFISCSRKPYDFYDSITTQFPQNNLGTIQAAMAAARLHELTREAAYRELALRLADDLALTQQVWNHPLLAPKVVGGMTTQNSDAEWSDARQCYAAIVFLNAYDLGGGREHLERAVAAARSTFAVAPWENWSHEGHGDAPGAMTGIHWGTGSAMATVEMMAPRLGDAYVNAARGDGVGFNGCTLEALEISGDEVRLKLTGVPEWKGKRARLRFEGLDRSRRYRILVNGGSVGEFPGATLLDDGAEGPIR